MFAMYYHESDIIAAEYPALAEKIRLVDTYLNERNTIPFFAGQAADKLGLQLSDIDTILTLYRQHDVISRRRVWICPVDGQEIDFISEELLHCDLCDKNYEESSCQQIALYTPGASTNSDTLGEMDMSKTNVFIGHGRSPLWREVKDFVQERLKLPYDEFNRESTAGISTTERLSQMLDNAAFALLIMTGEDEAADGKKQARMNVIHEAGLFQGRLGFKKAIILLEAGCEDFSNIHGLVHIPFPKGNIAAAYEEIRRVLEREGVLPH